MQLNEAKATTGKFQFNQSVMHKKIYVYHLMYIQFNECAMR